MVTLRVIHTTCPPFVCDLLRQYKWFEKGCTMSVVRVYTPESFLTKTQLTLAIPVLSGLQFLSMEVARYLDSMIAAYLSVFGVAILTGLVCARYIRTFILTVVWACAFGVFPPIYIEVRRYLSLDRFGKWLSPYVDDFWNVVIDWVPFATRNAMIVLAIWVGVRLLRGPIVLQDGSICPVCAYSLIGNVSGICPECGTAIRTKVRSSGTDENVID
jgi:hypothetical protein